MSRRFCYWYRLKAHCILLATWHTTGILSSNASYTMKVYCGNKSLDFSHQMVCIFSSSVLFVVLKIPGSRWHSIHRLQTTGILTSHGTPTKVFSSMSLLCGCFVPLIRFAAQGPIPHPDLQELWCLEEVERKLMLDYGMVYEGSFIDSTAVQEEARRHANSAWEKSSSLFLCFFWKDDNEAEDLKLHRLYHLCIELSQLNIKIGPASVVSSFGAFCLLRS